MASSCFGQHALHLHIGKVVPERLTCAERLQYEGYLRGEATGEVIMALSRQGMLIKTTARRTGHSRKLVRNVLRGLTGAVFRARHSSLDAYLPRIDAEWAAAATGRSSGGGFGQAGSPETRGWLSPRRAGRGG